MTPARRAELPVRFVDAQEINPFKLLLDLHDHAVAWTPGSGRDDVLAELALSAAVVSRWTSWQPLMIHAALRAGADLADIAEATGLEVDEVVRRWRRWADVQTRLDIGGRPAVDPVEVRAIEHRLGPGVVR
ncbi:hypothetical protein ACN27F_28130 [Solwaraspora sp. WMMB335]|uniref:hypothetical protein n=1 Tax=Solwaraspora sp. WMMB335 TaxID=3404118 RepID=UPI003B95D100